MKLLYIGTDNVQQDITEALNGATNNHEVLTAMAKEDLIATLEQGLVNIILFDCICQANISLQQVILYASAFKAPVMALTSAMSNATDNKPPVDGISGYVFREHLDQLPFIISAMAERTQLKKEKQDLLQRLERNGHFYQTLLKHIDDFVFLFDEKGELAYLSPSAHQLTGFRGLEGRQLFEYIHPDDRKKFFYLFKKVLKKPDARVEAHFRILHKAGHYIWIEGSITNLVKDEAIEAFVLSCRDVTERTETERALVRINRLYDCIRQINRAILSTEHEQALFKEICHITTAYGSFKMAFISVIDSSTGKLKLVQSSGVAEVDVEPSMVVQDLELAPFEGVLQKGETYVCNNVQDDEFDAGYWKYVATQKGFNSFVVLPLCKQGRIIGVFVMAAAGTDAFTVKEIELLEETVDDVSFKLEVLKKDKVRAMQASVPGNHQYLQTGTAGLA